MPLVSLYENQVITWLVEHLVEELLTCARARMRVCHVSTFQKG